MIVIGESKQNQSNDVTGKIISKQLGIPIELLPLVEENIEDYIRFKKGKDINIPDGAKIDGVPVTAFEKKKILK